MVSINFISHRFDSTGNQTPDLQNAKPVLYRFGDSAQTQSVAINKDVQPVIVDQSLFLVVNSWGEFVRAKNRFGHANDVIVAVIGGRDTFIYSPS